VADEIGLAAEVYIGEPGARHFSGSAAFISKQLAFTMDFVLTGGARLWLQPFGTSELLECQVVWAEKASGDRTAGLALLRISNPSEAYSGIKPPRLGRLVGTGARDAEMVGYTLIRALRDTAVAQGIRGSVESTYFLDSDILRFLPGRPLENWRGLGGAGLYCDGHLVGLMAQYFDGGTIWVVPITRAIASSDFLSVAGGELGRSIDVTNLPAEEPTVSAALGSVFNADPANIQQVAASQLALSNRYYENVLTQARRSFNSAVAAAAVGLVFFMAAIGFALDSRDLAAPLVSAVGGGIVEVVSGLNFWLYSRTALQLNSFHQRLERMQRFLVANSVAANLDDDHRDEALVGLIRVIAAVDHSEGTTRS